MKLAAPVLTLALFTGACSRLPTSEVAIDATANEPLALTTGDSMSALTSGETTLPATITPADVLDAIGHLATPSPMTITLRQFSDTDQNGVVAEGTETVVSDPASSIRHISVNHVALGAEIESMLSAAVQAEEESDAQDTFLPAYAAMAAGQLVAIDYVVDGETVWLPFAAYQAHDVAMMRVFSVLDGSEFGDALGEQSALGPALADKWMAQLAPAATEPFPSGRGADLTAELVFELLRDVGFEGTQAPPNMVITETGRTETLVAFALANGDQQVLVDLDANLDLVAIDQRPSPDAPGVRIEIVHRADPELLVLPREDRQLTLDQLASVIGIDPECMFDPTDSGPQSVPIECSQAMTAEEKFNTVSDAISG